MPDGDTLHAWCFASPVGQLRLIADDEALLEVRVEPSGTFENLQVPLTETKRRSNEVLQIAAAQLREYFAGTRRSFNVPLRPEGTPFQRRVWRELQQIGFGERVTYAAIARQIGHSRGWRAVGAANGSNPIAIIIPCHRVVGSNGALRGYAAGIEIKRWLLNHETHQHGQRQADRVPRSRALIR